MIMLKLLPISFLIPLVFLLPPPEVLPNPLLLHIHPLNLLDKIPNAILVIPLFRIIQPLIETFGLPLLLQLTIQHLNLVVHPHHLVIIALLHLHL